MTSSATEHLNARPPLSVSIVLAVTGALGLLASFALTVEKFVTLTNPTAALSCDFSLLVQCGKNLASPEGSVLGFPNPLIGIAGYATVIAVSAGLLAGARYARWFWLLLNAGLLGAIAFVGWLISVSIFTLGTLCPWCMLVWAVTIPLFLTVTLHNVRSAAIPLPARARQAIGGAYFWIPFLTVLAYILIAVLAQSRLDVIGYL